MSETLEWFLDFAKANYDNPKPIAVLPDARTGGIRYEYMQPELLVCKRCGMSVGYPTKHAAERHGMDVEVLPVTADHQELAAVY